jgi:hypothetical protein
MSAVSSPMAAADANNIISVTFDKNTDKFRSACDGNEFTECSEDTLRFLKKCRGMTRGDENVIHLSARTEEWIAFQDLCQILASDAFDCDTRVKTFVYNHTNIAPKFSELFKELQIMDAKAEKIMPVLANPHKEFIQLTLVEDDQSKFMSIRPTLKSNFYRFKSTSKPKKKAADNDNEGGSSSKKRKQDNNTESEAEELQIIKITNCVILNKDGEIIPKNAISFSLVDGSDKVFNANVCRALNSIALKYVSMTAHNEQSIHSIIRFMRMNKGFMDSDNSMLLDTLMRYNGTPRLLLSELISTAPISDQVRSESEHIVDRLRISACVQAECGITRMIFQKAE